MSNVKLYQPQTQKELLRALSEADVNTVIVAGGTDAVIKMRSVGFYEGKLIDLSGMSDLKYIREVEDEIRIGALATLTMVEESDLIQKYYPVLSKAVSVVGSTQIRNLGTLPGNLCNASPCADSVPALMAADAIVKVMDSNGDIRDCTPDEIIYGQGRNLLKPGELITEIVIPKDKKEWLNGYQKIGSRKAVTIAKLNGCVLVRNQGDKIEEVRVFVGSLGIKAFRANLAEKAIIGACLDKNLSEKLYQGLAETVDAAINGRSSYAYKRDSIRGLADDIARQLRLQYNKEGHSDDVKTHREIVSSS